MSLFGGAKKFALEFVVTSYNATLQASNGDPRSIWCGSTIDSTANTWLRMSYTSYVWLNLTVLDGILAEKEIETYWTWNGNGSNNPNSLFDHFLLVVNGDAAATPASRIAVYQNGVALTPSSLSSSEINYLANGATMPDFDDEIFFNNLTDLTDNFFGSCKYIRCYKDFVGDANGDMGAAEALALYNGANPTGYGMTDGWDFRQMQPGDVVGGALSVPNLVSGRPNLEIAASATITSIT